MPRRWRASSRRRPHFSFRKVAVALHHDYTTYRALDVFEKVNQDLRSKACTGLRTTETISDRSIDRIATLVRHRLTAPHAYQGEYSWSATIRSRGATPPVRKILDKAQGLRRHRWTGLPPTIPGFAGLLVTADVASRLTRSAIVSIARPRFGCGPRTSPGSQREARKAASRPGSSRYIVPDRDFFSCDEARSPARRAPHRSWRPHRLRSGDFKALDATAPPRQCRIGRLSVASGYAIGRCGRKGAGGEVRPCRRAVRHAARARHDHASLSGRSLRPISRAFGALGCACWRCEIGRRPTLRAG